MPSVIKCHWDFSWGNATCLEDEGGFQNTQDLQKAGLQGAGREQAGDVQMELDRVWGSGGIVGVEVSEPLNAWAPPAVALGAGVVLQGGSQAGSCRAATSGQKTEGASIEDTRGSTAI